MQLEVELILIGLPSKMLLYRGIEFFKFLSFDVFAKYAH